MQDRVSCYRATKTTTKGTGTFVVESVQMFARYRFVCVAL